MTMMPPADLQALEKIARLALAVDCLTGTEREVAERVLDYCEADGSESFERTVARPVSLADRNARIWLLKLQLWLELESGPAASAMAEAFATYLTSCWPRQRRLSTPPAREPHATFWHILRGGARVPHYKQLKRILADMGRAECPREGARDEERKECTI